MGEKKRKCMKQKRPKQTTKQTTQAREQNQEDEKTTKKRTPTRNAETHLLSSQGSLHSL